ncbi:hypothetical protein FOL47_010898, partial [Perkinsus chesapeaki]
SGWSPSTSAFKPSRDDKSVIDSPSFTRGDLDNLKAAQNNEKDAIDKSADEAPWKVTSTNRAVDPADESPLTALAGAVPRMVDEALERAQSFLRDHAPGGKEAPELPKSVPGESQGKEHIQNANGGSIGTAAVTNPVRSTSPLETGAANKTAKDGGMVDPQDIAEMVRQAVAGMLDERLRSREEEQMKLVQKALEESKSLSERAAQLEAALGEAKQRELELEKKIDQKVHEEEESKEGELVGNAPIPLSKSILPSQVAMPEDTRTFKSNSVGSGTPRASKEDHKQPSSRPPAAPRRATEQQVTTHTTLYCPSHGLPLLLWNEATQQTTCAGCEGEQKGRYGYSFGSSPRGSARACSVAEACEAKLRMMEGSLREFDDVKAVMLEEEIRRTEGKLEELTQLVTTAARDLREDFEQAMELLQSTQRVKEHMLVDHRQQLDGISKKVTQLHRAHEEGAKACETADHEECELHIVRLDTSHSLLLKLALMLEYCSLALLPHFYIWPLVPLEDIPFEVNKRRDLLRKAQCFEKLTLVKNQVLCDIVQALKAEKANHADTRDYAAEMESLLDAYADEWERRFNYVCSYCGQQLEPSLANELYCESTGGQKAHYWVPADRAMPEEAKASLRPQLPKLPSGSPRARSNQKISAVSPMFRGDSSVEGSPASRCARKGPHSPRIGVERTDSEILSIVGSILREKFPQDGVLEIEKFIKLYDVDETDIR